MFGARLIQYAARYSKGVHNRNLCICPIGADCYPRYTEITQ